MTLSNATSTACSDKQQRVLVTSAPGLAELLAAELAELSLKVTLEGQAAVNVEASIEDALRICLYSRLAERVLWRVAAADVPASKAAVSLAENFHWERHLAVADAVHVEVETTRQVTTNRLVLSREFIAAAPQRLNLSSTAENALTLHLFVAEERAELSIDLSGMSLQRRGYRLAGGKAPLRETLAAAMLRAAGWQGDQPLLDPFCGSGTILIEAAMQARRMPPGLERRFYGFMQWADCDADIWPRLCREARAQIRPLPEGVSLKGFDADASSLRFAHANAERAGVADCIHFERRELGAMRARDLSGRGAIVTNPPWGERLDNEEIAGWLHAALGQTITELAPDWSVTLLGARVAVLDRCGMQLLDQVTLLNGAEKNWIRRYLPTRRVPAEVLQAGAASFEVEEEAQALVNRLRKNGRQLKSWLKQTQVQCYRLYDRDLPQFNFIIDVYGDRVLMQEQKAPKTVDEDKVRARRKLALSAVRSSLGCHREQLFVRTRERQKGNQQYRKLAATGRYHIVREGAARLLVNFQDYHDSGLFLDHRPIRLRIAREAAGKRFLNLFAYTGSVSVHAALGGARMSVTVDASKRYLDWAANNLAVNGFSTQNHQLVCADVRRWIADNHDQFDIIFCDPPTFSNSKSRDDFVVQRDHGAMIRSLMKALTPDGVLYFSCNFRDFKLDETLLDGFQVEDISQATLDRDFARHPDIHYCFAIRHDH